MNKVVYVKSYFKVIKEAPTEAWSDGKGPEYSDSLIDGERLANDIALAVEALNADGFELQSILPITSGSYDYAENRGAGLLGGGGYGYGFSFTEGVTLIGRQVMQTVPELSTSLVSASRESPASDDLPEQHHDSVHEPHH